MGSAYEMFPKIRVPCFGILIRRILLVSILRSPCFRKLPYRIMHLPIPVHIHVYIYTHRFIDVDLEIDTTM